MKTTFYHTFACAACPGIVQVKVTDITVGLS